MRSPPTMAIPRSVFCEVKKCHECQDPNLVRNVLIIVLKSPSNNVRLCINVE